MRDNSRDIVVGTISHHFLDMSSLHRLISDVIVLSFLSISDVSPDDMSCRLSVTAFPTKLMTCCAILAKNYVILRKNGRFLDAVSPILAIFGQHFSMLSRLDQNVIRNVMLSQRCRRHVVGNVVGNMSEMSCHLCVVSSRQHVVSPRTTKIYVLHPCPTCMMKIHDISRYPIFLDILGKFQVFQGLFEVLRMQAIYSKGSFTPFYVW